jgi:prefoldin subunit 5
MEIIKNLKRNLREAADKMAEVDSLHEALLQQNQEKSKEIASLYRRNDALQAALCRCRDMIEQLKNAGSPNELEHEANIYLGILEALINERVILPFADPKEYVDKLYERLLAPALGEGEE